ncbi:hypothetical protein HOY82DRAFT_331356 [Tuber indicum]|nr:hypothetical protein HOY82DRAFT_331356 [Tuber indicum]
MQALHARSTVTVLEYAAAGVLRTFVCLSLASVGCGFPSPPLPPEIPSLLLSSPRQPPTPVPPDQPTACYEYGYYLCIPSLFFHFFSPLSLFLLYLRSLPVADCLAPTGKELFLSHHTPFKTSNP